MNFKIILVILSAIGLAGCETMGGPNQTGGTLIGAASGAVLGSQFGKGSGQLVGVALGTFIGSQIGASIGKQMDERDRQLAGRSAVNALENQPDNRAVTWTNPNNQHSGQIVVTKTEENLARNQVCRDYVQTVTIDGQQERISGRACRDVRDVKGQWMVVQ
jgi:surface antigen